MVREACLWWALTTTDGEQGLDSENWWRYKEGFMANCTTAKNTYTQDCSYEVFATIGISKKAEQKWADCFKPVIYFGKTSKVRA